MSTLVPALLSRAGPARAPLGAEHRGSGSYLPLSRDLFGPTVGMKLDKT
jgi:hypothetical protein